MTIGRTMAALLAAGAWIGPAQAATDAESAGVDAFVATPALTPKDAAEVSATCVAGLAKAAALRATLERETGPATVAGTLRRFDNLQRLLGAVSNDASLLGEIAPDDARREAGRACAGKADDARNAVQLSRPIYERLKAIDRAKADPVARYLLARALADYERAGVAGDAGKRARIEALQAKITAAGIAFEANIANGRKTVKAKPAELAGLPADFLAAHKPGADGLVEISTDYPDYGPVMLYAADAALRQRLQAAYLTRAAPANDAVLTQMLATRDTLAHELGRPDFATLALEDKMVATPAKARALLDAIAVTAEAPAKRDKARMLERLRKIDPSASDVPLWSSIYVAQLIRKEGYAVDPQEVRRYFAYDNVRDGILKLSADLFGVEIRPWQTTTWDPSVEPYEMMQDGAVIGRFYFDAHPRPGKYSHANVVPIRSGLAGRALPVAALVTNFPAGGHATGLMEHRDVETFLHEYGHLLHVLFSGRQDWTLASMGAVEWDFIEAPSQMLENWVWDYDTLKRFAVDEKGQPIPRDLVERMNRSRYFAEAFGDRRQLGLSNISLSYHLGPPPADLAAAYRTADARYSLIGTAPGLQPQDSFGHLGGYSAYYYTYMWSKLIATDLFTAFDTAGLRDPATARRYRDLVLAPGGSKPAAQLIADFLGRPVSMDAYKARLAKGE